jgi:hypothetical protein
VALRCSFAVMAILLAKPLITLGASLQRGCQGQEAWVPHISQIDLALTGGTATRTMPAMAAAISRRRMGQQQMRHYPAVLLDANGAYVAAKPADSRSLRLD